MGLLNRLKLLEKEKIQIVKVDLGKDESGEEVYVFVKQMMACDRDRFEKSLLDEKRDTDGKIQTYEYNHENFRCKLAVNTICDENGNLLLRENDYIALSQNMSANTLEKIINEAQAINNITKKDKEALIKNSDAGLGDNSSSGSAES